MDKRKLLIGGSIALVVIGLIIGIVIFVRKKMAANAMAANTSGNTMVPNPGNSFAPGQRIPREFPTKEELILLAVKKNWDNGNEAKAIAATYDENKGTWHRGDWRFIITGNNPITAKGFKGAGEKFDLSYSGRQIVYLS